MIIELFMSDFYPVLHSDQKLMKKHWDQMKLDEDEIMDILDFGTPNLWQCEMAIQGFDPIDKTPDSFVQFYKHFE